MDGLSFLRVVRADPALAGVPVVVTTARSDADTAGQTAALGVRHHLVKAGHSMAELLDAVRQSLSPEAGRAA
jgi:CheY-like chemotaxis protein